MRAYFLVKIKSGSGVIREKARLDRGAQTFKSIRESSREECGRDDERSSRG